MIDERALEAASEAVSRMRLQLSLGENGEPIVTFDPKMIAVMIVKAYEAAKWRPIEEAPRDGSTIQIQSEKLKRPFPLFANWEDADWGGPGFRVGVVIFEIGSAHLQGATFRTIDPPEGKKK